MQETNTIGATRLKNFIFSWLTTIVPLPDPEEGGHYPFKVELAKYDEIDIILPVNKYDEISYILSKVEHQLHKGESQLLKESDAYEASDVFFTEQLIPLPKEFLYKIESVELKNLIPIDIPQTHKLLSAFAIDPSMDLFDMDLDTDSFVFTLNLRFIPGDKFRYIDLESIRNLFGEKECTDYYEDLITDYHDEIGEICDTFELIYPAFDAEYDDIDEGDEAELQDELDEEQQDIFVQDASSDEALDYVPVGQEEESELTIC